MLSLFLLTINSLKLSIPIVSLYGSAPTYFLLWSLLKTVTSFFPSSNIYRISDDYLYSIYQRFVLFFFQNCLSVKVFLHGDYQQIFNRKENVLYLSNHQSSVDWIIVNMLSVHQQSVGHVRYILKEDLKWIPFYGFYFQQHGCIYVRRNDKNDLNRLEKGMQRVVSNGLPIWLVIFPEGTRFNRLTHRQTLIKSQEFTKEKNLIPLEYLLYPRSRATIAAIETLQHHLDAVYDITICYHKKSFSSSNSPPNLIQYLSGELDQLHIDVRRIDLSQIPKETPEQISNWLYQRFYLKDKLIKNFVEFPGDKSEFRCDENDNPIELELPLTQTFPSFAFLMLVTMSLLLTKQGRQIYFKTCLFVTPLTLLWMHLFPQ